MTREESSAKFMAKLWKNSKPSKSGTLVNLIQYVFSTEFENDVRKKMDTVLARNDFQMLEICKKLQKDVTTNTLQSIYNSVVKPDFLLTINKITYALEECESIVKSFIDFELSGSLVELLGDSTSDLKKCEEETKKWFRDINCDAIGLSKVSWPDDRIDRREMVGGNILYHAFNIGDNKNIASKPTFT